MKLVVLTGIPGSGSSTLLKKALEEAKELAEEEKVNHPSHYNRENAMECIDEMILVFGEEAVKHFCLCNAWKYRYRAADKNGAEDIAKSDWYIRKYKELCEKSNISITTASSGSELSIPWKDPMAYPSVIYASKVDNDSF